MADAPKRGPGQPRKPDAKIVRGIRLRPSTLEAMATDPRSPDDIMRAGLGLS